MNKNKKILLNFIQYCAKHPDQRFWQALRNWSNIPFIYSSEHAVGVCIEEEFCKNVIDTFYFEGKEK